MSENKNLPAYPASGSWNDSQPEIITVIQEGLTKRELAAFMAMQGMLMNAELIHESESLKGICKDAILFADELLNQLST